MHLAADGEVPVELAEGGAGVLAIHAQENTFLPINVGTRPLKWNRSFGREPTHELLNSAHFQFAFRRRRLHVAKLLRKLAGELHRFRLHKFKVAVHYTLPPMDSL